MAVRSAFLNALAIGLVPIAPAHANWPSQGVVVATPPPPITAFGETVLLAAPDGSVIALGAGATAMSQYWGSQRVTPYGDLTPVWPGLLENSTIGTSNSQGILSHMGVGFSSSGDLLTSWTAGPGTTIFAQRIADWATAAPTLTDRSFTNPLGWSPYFARLAPAAGNDVYFYYGNGFTASKSPRLMRRTSAGAVSPGWPVNGKRAFPTTVYDGAVLPDGAGGVIVSARTAGFEFRVMRINADTTFGVGWTGLALSSNCDYADEQDFPQLLPSGTDGYLACWSDLQPATSPPTREISITRFLATGTMDPDWPAEAIQIAFPSSTDPRFAVIPDGTGGAFVLFEREGEPRGTHLLSNGTLDPGLAGPDVPLLDAAAQYVPGKYKSVRVPLVAAPGKNGGLVFVWVDDRDAPEGSLRARWLTSSLTPDPSEPATPRRIPTQSATLEDARAAISDGHGGVYVAWGDVLPDAAVVMVQRVLASEFLSASAPPRATSLALSAPRPNPARGAVALDVTLPDDSPARVELLDVAGRVVRTQAVQGAGAHAIVFDYLATLEPGLYFARVTGRAGNTAARVVVSR